MTPKDIPIIMSAPMVRATLREVETPGTGKTMTRRLAWGKRHKAAELSSEQQEHYDALGYHIDAAGEWFQKPSPWQRVKPGDRLWVRETWMPRAHYEVGGRTTDLRFAADFKDYQGKWRSPIHMPRWASRLTLVVTATKIEKVSNISEADAIAEGIGRNPVQEGTWIAYPERSSAAGYMKATESFRSLWVDLHGAASWVDNVEVVALTFDVHKTNIDAMPK